ncbi:MAG TPA: ABC transporter permease [Puia sp.]|jgi:putative ABC transport system permease protein|nr:ABC transporter permease [Puia sp.]
MLKNYLRIAVRNLTKYKLISFINLFGLTVGLTCCLLILSYILHETSYDRYNSKADRTWRVTRSFNNPDGVVSLHLGTVAPPFGPLLRNDFPDIQKMTRLLEIEHATPMRYGDKIFSEQNIFFADTNFVDIFDITFLEGNPNTALTDPNSILLTPDVARKYFGDADPMNKVIRMDNQINFKVTGIYKPFPSAAHLHPKLLLSFCTLNDSTIYGEKGLRTNWGNNSFFTYILLPKDYPVQSMVAQFPAFLDRHMPTDGAPPGYKPHKGTKLFLQPLTSIHLHSHLDSEAEENGDASRVTIFGAIALFILLIACINYMNLSTARSSLRAREIGIRKVSGAVRQEIIFQFLSESILFSYIALILAAVLTWVALPALDSVTGLTLSVNTLLQPVILIPLLLTPLLVGILSGLYPALFLSSFQPSKVLKGLFKAGSGSISFRKVLVVTQFAISIVLLISTAIVFQQLHFMQNTSLGFDKDHIVTMNYNAGLDKTYESFRSRLLQDPHIREITRSSRIPSGRLLDEQGAATQSGDSLRPVTADIKYLTVDHDFLSTFGIPIAAGRDYSRLYATDTTAFILNYAATKALGIRDPAEMIGRNFSYGGTKGKIIGIMKDFNFESLHQSIVPLILTLPAPSEAASNSFAKMSIKLVGNKDNMTEALNRLGSAWKTYLPEVPFEYTFLDERFDQLYQSEERQGTLFTVFSGIAIFIACLGLLGLSAFSISQRIKEIGIRKVLGASTGGLIRLLSVDFLKLVALAALIAFPIAWYAMHNWLSDFAYRISIQWWIFGIAGLLAAVVALATISFQALKAALANPVNSLRAE